VPLNTYAAQAKRALLDDLLAGRDPSQGTFDPALLKEARTKGQPQMGTTRFEPDALILEFIFPETAGGTVVFPVRLASPERIVFLPVPSWVIENIWQGDVAGSYHFESDAQRLLAEFEAELGPEANQKWFTPQAAKRRE